MSVLPNQTFINPSKEFYIPQNGLVDSLTVSSFTVSSINGGTPGGGGGGGGGLPANLSANTLTVSTIGNLFNYAGASNTAFQPVFFDQYAPVGSEMPKMEMKIRQRALDAGAIVSLTMGTDFKNGTSYINSAWDSYIPMPLVMNIQDLTINDEIGECMFVNNEVVRAPQMSTINLQTATINGAPYSVGSAPLTQTFLDVKPNGTSGGVAPVTGTYFQRELNTGIPALSGSSSTIISGMELSGNQVTVPLGTYIVSANGIGCRVGRMKIQLYDATNSVILTTGQNAYANASDFDESISPILNYTLVVTGSPIVLEVQQCVELTNGPKDLGLECAFGDDEIYTQLSFTRIA